MLNQGGNDKTEESVGDVGSREGRKVAIRTSSAIDWGHREIRIGRESWE